VKSWVLNISRLLRLDVGSNNLGAGMMLLRHGRDSNPVKVEIRGKRDDAWSMSEACRIAQHVQSRVEKINSISWQLVGFKIPKSPHEQHHWIRSPRYHGGQGNLLVCTLDSDAT
jgi:hypothetical protein